MKKKIVGGTAVVALVVSLLFGVSQPANAGQLSTGGTSISWDESTFYYPSGCSQFVFNYTNGPTVNFGSIQIVNKFGDTLGSQMVSGSQGSARMQICNTYADPSLAPFVISLEVHQSYARGDGSTSVVSTPLVFLSRTASGTSGLTYVCVNKKTLNVTRASGKSCPSGSVLKSFK